MPAQTKPRQRAPGGGRKTLIANRVPVTTYLEAEEADSLDLLAAVDGASRADLVRELLRAHLAKEDVAARLSDLREQLARPEAEGV